jgi:hypothetical protein
VDVGLNQEPFFFAQRPVDCGAIEKKITASAKLLHFFAQNHAISPPLSLIIETVV